MLQICFGIYLALALPAALLLWAALAASKEHDIDGGEDRRRHYQIALTVTNRQNAQSVFRKEVDLCQPQKIQKHHQS